MMLLYPLTIALLVGILSSTPARGRMMARRPRPVGFFSMDSYIQILDPKNYINFSQEQCEINGGPTAYDDLEANLQQFRVNVRNLVDPLRLETELALLRPRARLPSVVQKYCRKVSMLKKYINRVTYSIQTCMDEEGVLRVISDRHFVNSFLDYICRDEGSGLATFIADGGMECLAAKKQELLNCANESFSRYLPDLEFVGDGVSEVKGFEALYSLDTKRCSDVRNFRECFSDVVDDCEEPMTANVMKVLVEDLIIKRTSCDSSTTEDLSLAVTVAPIDAPREHEHFESFMMKKCVKTGGGSLAFGAIDENFRLIDSVSKMLDLKRLIDEIEYAAVEPNSYFDDTLMLYCRKVPIVVEVEKFMTDTFKQCLEAPDEQLTADIFHNVTSSLLRHVCYNDGNGIAAFVAADGVQCFNSKLKDLTDCVDDVFGVYFEEEGWKKRESPDTPFVINFEDCKDMEKLRNCSVQALAECDDKTASYMLDSMFDIIHDKMLCEELREIELHKTMTEAEMEAIRFEEYLKNTCEKNGGPTAYEAVKEVPKYFAIAAKLVTMNAHQIQDDLISAKIHGGIEAFSKKYCRKIPSLQKFVKHIRSSVTPCLTPEIQTEFDFKIDFTSSVFDFVCENEGARFTELFNSDGLKCIDSKQNALADCIPDIYRSESGLVKLREDLVANNCTACKQIQKCYVDALNTCPDPTAARIVNDFIDSYTEDVASED